MTEEEKYALETGIEMLKELGSTNLSRWLTSSSKTNWGFM